MPAKVWFWKDLIFFVNFRKHLVLGIPVGNSVMSFQLPVKNLPTEEKRIFSVPAKAGMLLQFEAAAEGPYLIG